jgi:FAD/FMN-containing dehydrogenase
MCKSSDSSLSKKLSTYEYIQCENLGGKITVLYPNNATFSTSQNSYWAQQQRETIPSCRVIPVNSDEVAKAVKALSSRNCRFSIRSGGHSNVVGASNIENGVSIDLSSLNSVDVSLDKATAFVGPGARWGEVYTQLESKGLAVVGGRVSDVGVGGVVLGGGMSYFSNRYGWAADNVQNFEVPFQKRIHQYIRLTRKR